MSPTKMTGNLLAWGLKGIETNTILQASKTARLPFVDGHVALMPDAHVGMGSTVGSVIPTRGAIIPAAIGVDIGCGMIAVRTNLDEADLPDNLDALMPLIERRIPAGVGKGFQNTNHHGTQTWFDAHPFGGATDKQLTTAHRQFGTLGSGNHFVEVCLDETSGVWIVLHSGSRGIGNQLAKVHIDGAKADMKQRFITLEDPDLAYLVEGTPEFKAYIDAMLWAQDYALGNRERMMDEAVRSLTNLVPITQEVERINCHHNFTEREHHHGKDLWITRKGAIRMRSTDRGIIPGSMGTATYIVSGLGSSASYSSASHGAGRTMSRGAAKRALTADSLTAAMAGKTWNADRAASLVDEHPEAYKDIDAVMQAQQDLCAVEHELHQIFNYKG